MQGNRGKTLATALAIAATLAACDGKPSTSPVPTSPTSPTAPISITRLELIGPGTVFLGQTVQYTAIAHHTDSTTRNVTAEATWHSTNPSLMSLPARGQFTGRSKGQASVGVSLSGRNATMGEVIVVPEGTFRLTGTVRDAGTLVEADVRIEDEALGRTDLRTSQGRYVVYGVRGNTRVAVTKSGYETAVKIETLASHQAIDFDLALSRPRADLSGRYRLTITAAPECRLSPEFASRSFAAVVSQAGTEITVTLEGAQFVAAGGLTHNRFAGRLEADQVLFRLTGAFDFYYYYFTFPDVFEQLTPTSYYAFDGNAVAGLGAGTLSGPLLGTIGTYVGPPYRVASACRSGNHRLVLARSTS